MGGFVFGILSSQLVLIFTGRSIWFHGVRAVFKWLSTKPKPKQLIRPITTGAGSAMNQSQFLAITWNLLKAREKSRVHGAIGFGFASHWLKNWRESFKPIIKRSNRNHVITFDSHLKTALIWLLIWHSSVCLIPNLGVSRFTTCK